MNNYPRAGNAGMTEEMRPSRYPMQEVERGAISLAMQRLHEEIETLDKEISVLSERLAPISAGRPVGTAISGNDEKQGPASKHAEELRELQGMVHSCRNRINVLTGQLDI